MFFCTFVTPSSVLIEVSCPQPRSQSGLPRDPLPPTHPVSSARKGLPWSRLRVFLLSRTDLWKIHHTTTISEVSLSTFTLQMVLVGTFEVNRTRTSIILDTHLKLVSNLSTGSSPSWVRIYHSTSTTSATLVPLRRVPVHSEVFRWRGEGSLTRGKPVDHDTSLRLTHTIPGRELPQYPNTPLSY